MSAEYATEKRDTTKDILAESMEESGFQDYRILDTPNKTPQKTPKK
jgi:hypothetical protein